MAGESPSNVDKATFKHNIMNGAEENKRSSIIKPLLGCVETPIRNLLIAVDIKGTFSETSEDDDYDRN
jgi:tRNA(Ile)-lysidine synthase TilS/MesJ